jgi:hypothetical protein
MYIDCNENRGTPGTNGITTIADGPQPTSFCWSETFVVPRLRTRQRNLRHPYASYDRYYPLLGPKSGTPQTAQRAEGNQKAQQRIDVNDAEGVL